MTDERSQACRTFLERNADDVLRLARAYARTFGVAEEVTDVLQDSVEALLRHWERCTPSVRTGSGQCSAAPECRREAQYGVSLFRRRVESCEECLPDVVDDLRRGYLSGILAGRRSGPANGTGVAGGRPSTTRASRWPATPSAPGWTSSTRW